MKKFFFYLISFTIVFFLIETGSLIFVNKLKKNHLILNFKETYNETLNDYSEYIPYLRSDKNFNNLNNYIINKDEKNLFYTKIIPYSEKRKKNILIQGDSWAEMASKKINFDYIKNYALTNNYGVINAGISSYSPSPMTAQLYILRKEFKLNPSIIIAIIDQTDLGDEIFRHHKLDPNSLKLSKSNLQNKFLKKIFNILNEKNLSIIKLTKLSKKYFEYEKEKNNFNTILTIKFIYKKLKLKIINLPIQLSPLVYGVSEKEKKIFINSLNLYIETAFKDTNLKRIYFVTHPHKNHLNLNNKKKYILNISKIVDETINTSNFKNKIYHINFNKLDYFKSLENKIFLFDEDDIFSHLKEELYLSYFYPNILKKIN